MTWKQIVYWIKCKVIDSKIIKQISCVTLEVTEERLRAANESVIKTLGKV